MLIFSSSFKVARLNEKAYHIEKTRVTRRFNPGEQAQKLRIAEGDESAFTDLFNHYYPALRPFIWKFTGSQTDSEEILQETFIRIWLNRDKLPEIDNMRNWIFTIAANLCLLYIRKTLSTQKKENRYCQKQLAVSAETPAETFDYAEIMQLVNKAVERMPPQRKLIYRMSREEGLRPGEIAESIRVSISTVKNTLVTALKDIRSYLQEAGHLISFLLLLSLFL